MSSDFAETFVNLLNSLQPATARVEWIDDPEIPGLRAFRITGPSAAVVQSSIDTRMRAVDRRGGSAFFDVPYRTRDGYESRGYRRLEAAEAKA